MIVIFFNHTTRRLLEKEVSLDFWKENKKGLKENTSWKCLLTFSLLLNFNLLFKNGKIYLIAVWYTWIIYKTATSKF